MSSHGSCTDTEMPGDLALALIYTPATSSWGRTRMSSRLERTESHVAPEETFWESFLRADLPVWNHYSYLKAAYFVILEAASRGGNTAEMASLFDCHLSRLRNSLPERFSDAPNRTLTTFWLLQIQHAIREYRVYSDMDELPSREDFPEVLRHSPVLMDSHLWETYYSTGAMFWGLSKMEWRPANLRPLPTVTRFLSDPVTIPRVCDAAERLPRYALFVMQHVQRCGRPRAEVIQQALASLQKTIVRLRTMDSTVPPYSETQAYFWVEVVCAALQSLAGTSESSQKNITVLLDRLTFATFRELFDIDPDCWKKHYSKDVWNSMTARSRLVAPDISPLPTIITSPLGDAEVALIITQVESVALDPVRELPSTEELSFQASLALQQISELVAGSADITSHAHLILHLYTRLGEEVREDNTARTRSERAKRARTLFSGLSGRLVESATHRNFWIQLVLAAIFQTELEVIGVEERKSGSARQRFAEFTTINLHLLHEGLPMIYYSSDLWNCGESKQTILPPDRRCLVEVVEIDEKDGWVHV